VINKTILETTGQEWAKEVSLLIVVITLSITYQLS